VNIFLEPIIISLLFLLYFLSRERRKFFKKRVVLNAIYNLYRVARNVSLMLQSHDLQIRGDLVQLKKGGILYSFHFGVWELVPPTLKKLGYNIAILANRYSDNGNLLGKIADRMLQHLRSRNGVGIFYKDDVIKIVHFLKNGGILGVLVDGDTFYAKFEKVKKLSYICDVPLTSFAAYQDHGRGVLEINCDLDSLVKKRPYDYVWFYRSRGR